MSIDNYIIIIDARARLCALLQPSNHQTPITSSTPYWTNFSLFIYAYMDLVSLGPYQIDRLFPAKAPALADRNAIHMFSYVL